MFSGSQNRRLVLLTVFVALSLAGCDKSNEKDKGAGGAGTSTAQPPRQAEVPAEPIVIAPQALVKEFIDNPAANAKYPRLTPFKITGVVSGFGIGSVKLKNEDKDGQYAVDCSFKESDQPKIKNAKRGDKFTVIGKLNSFSESNKLVELISCTVAE